MFSELWKLFLIIWVLENSMIAIENINIIHFPLHKWESFLNSKIKVYRNKKSKLSQSTLLAGKT